MNYNFFDIHSHLHFKDFNEDRDSMILEMQKKGIGSMTIGTNYEDSKKAIALAEKYNNLFASVGLHPNGKDLWPSHESADSEVFDEEKYFELAKNKKVVAIGECGLDYFKFKGLSVELRNFIIEKQKEIFKKQIKIAVKLNKPLMLHGRPSSGSMDAYEDILTLLEEVKKEAGENLKGNAHFFAGNSEIAKRFFDIGFTISFSGVITFVRDYDEIIKSAPLEMLHAETDSPYVAPVPYRGKRNNPLYVEEVVKKIAEIKGLDVEEVGGQLIKNAERVFWGGR